MPPDAPPPDPAHRDRHEPGGGPDVFARWAERLEPWFPSAPLEARYGLDPVEYTARFLEALADPVTPWTGEWSGNRFAMRRRGHVFFHVRGRLEPSGAGSRVRARVRFAPQAWVWWLLVFHALFVAFALLWTMGTAHWWEAGGVAGFVLIYGGMVRVLLLDDLQQTRAAAERELRYLGER
jgi:hypothetical protein